MVLSFVCPSLLFPPPLLVACLESLVGTHAEVVARAGGEAERLAGILVGTELLECDVMPLVALLLPLVRPYWLSWPRSARW